MKVYVVDEITGAGYHRELDSIWDAEDAALDYGYKKFYVRIGPVEDDGFDVTEVEVRLSTPKVKK